MFPSGMERMFPGLFGMEQFCSGRGGDSGPWVIPGGDSAPTKCSPQRQLSGEGRNITGTCGAELCSRKRGGISGPTLGGDSGLTTVHHATQASGKGRNLPGSSGAELLFQCPRAETPANPGRDSAPRKFFQET